MAYKVHISAPAKKRLDEAVDYIVRDLAAPQAAGKLGIAFGNLLDNLEAFPYMYPIDMRLQSLSDKELRIAPVRGYRAFYFVDERLKTVFIVSFLHMRQSVQRHISSDFQQDGESASQ